MTTLLVLSLILLIVLAVAAGASLDLAWQRGIYRRIANAQRQLADTHLMADHCIHCSRHSRRYTQDGMTRIMLAEEISHHE